LTANKNLATKTVRSGAWMYGRGVFTGILNLGVMAILARTLAPAEFGLVALANVLLRFLAILASDGVESYVIYDNQEGREERAQAAFWMDLVLSGGVALLCTAGIPLITRFYDEPSLGAILIALLLRYVITTMTAVPDGLLKKNMDFQKLVMRDTFLEIASGLFSVVLALLGWGAWSLVLPNLVMAPLRVGMVFWMAHWVPRLPLRLSMWRTVFRFSANIIGGNLASSISTEGDTLIIGKSLGAGPLGLYNLAWQSSMLVSRNISTTVAKLAMPALSAVTGNPDRLRSVFYRMHRILGIINFPLLIGLFVIADQFILAIYGPKWVDTILPLRILLVFALRHSVGAPSTVIFNAVGRPGLSLKWSAFFNIPLYLLCIVAGSRYGIVGVAVGVTFARTLSGFVQFWVTTRLIGGSFTHLMGVLAYPLSAAVLMGLLLVVTRLFIRQLSMNIYLELIICILVGGLAYLILLLLFFRPLLDDLLSLAENLNHSFGNRLRGLLGFAKV
jgi:PST family polysaccharide transporter